MNYRVEAQVAENELGALIVANLNGCFAKPEEEDSIRQPTIIGFQSGVSFASYFCMKNKTLDIPPQEIEKKAEALVKEIRIETPTESGTNFVKGVLRTAFISGIDFALTQFKESCSVAEEVE